VSNNEFAQPNNDSKSQLHEHDFGFEPNLLATMAQSPSTLRVYLDADLGFQHGKLTPGEQQIVPSGCQ
jgi:hypothetical protein